MVVDKSKYGVHENHCCAIHGCKYGDETVTPDQFITLKQITELLQSVDQNLIPVVAFNNKEYSPFQFYSVSEYIDSGEICYREEEGEELLKDFDSFATFAE